MARQAGTLVGGLEERGGTDRDVPPSDGSLLRLHLLHLNVSWGLQQRLQAAVWLLWYVGAFRAETLVFLSVSFHVVIVLLDIHRNTYRQEFTHTGQEFTLRNVTVSFCLVVHS